ncbi:hypothetical protein DJ568_14440 [Mucilaginibacter hurinus]|uniref:DUF4625 domain-containing protein n=1 Tax=Mucilaginibacter hurinus TaxID=2201324 RepID=A0A367GM34_9SPHI|nr:hypothetical protein [Mucilaginibacter hurinus]RCH54078.1 hypothetical protein DJ568_14440 [Mucilaginibacter hurinus]
MKTLSRNILAAIIIGSTLFLNACKKDNPVPEVNQEEFDGAVFNFIELEGHDDHFHETTDTTKVILKADGSASPSHMHLTEGHTYKLLINIFKNNRIINQEFIDEGDIHQFFFIPSKPDYIKYTYLDRDKNDRPIGFVGNVEVLKADNGAFDFKVVLRHGLNKAHSAAQAWDNANYSQAGGATDMEAEFEIHPSEHDGHDHEDH